MSTRIRLTRRGRKKLALYDIVVADSRAPRDGRFIEKIGSYNPNTNPATIDILEDKALDWLMKGAQPSDTVRAMLSYKGLLLRKHLKMGVLKGAISEEEAESKYEDWKKGKDDRVNQKVAGLDKKKEDDKKARFEAETKVNEARAEAIRKKNIVEEAPAEAEDGTVVETEVVVNDAVTPTEAEGDMVAESEVTEADAVTPAEVAESIVAETDAIAPAKTEEGTVVETEVEAAVAERKETPSDISTEVEETVEESTSSELASNETSDSEDDTKEA